jgi:two-component system, probable response regulator PhcQ
MTQTVLFVDDDANLLAGVLRSLRSEPYCCLTATSGEQALEMLETKAIDVVVSDEQMPGMGGLELLTTVHQRHPEIVNVMLSGQASIGTVVRALNHGQIFRFLIKPCGTDELCANIRQALGHKLVLDRCRMILPLVRRQAGILQTLERKNPGIIRKIELEIGVRSASKEIEDFTSVEDISERMDVVIRQADQHLGKPDAIDVTPPNHP